MNISLAQIFAISSIAYLCGLSMLSGFALSAIYQINKQRFVGGFNPRSIVWIVAMCLGIAAATLGSLFAFILLVIGNDSSGGNFLGRALFFFIFLFLGITFSLVVASMFNSAIKSGRLVVDKSGSR